METNREHSFRLHGDESLSSHLQGDRIYLDAGHGFVTAGLRVAPQEPQSISFTVESQKVLELRENGDIYVQGRLADNDTQVVDALRTFLSGQGML